MVRESRFDNSNGKHQRKDSMTTIEIEDQTKYKTSDRTESEMDHYFDAGADEHRGSGKRNKMKRLIATQSIVNN